MTQQRNRTGSSIRMTSFPVFARRRKMVEPVSFSPSSLGLFRQCKLRYKFHYIDKLGEQFEKPRPYYTMANHVHDTLRDFLSIPHIGQRTPASMERLFWKNWRRYKAGFTSRKNEQVWAEKALAQVRRFAQEQDIEVYPLMLEQPVGAELTSGLTLHGRVDRGDAEPEGLHIIDYKTGKMPEVENWTQLLLYALIIQNQFGYDVARVSFLYLETGLWQTIDVGSQAVEQQTWDALATVGRILRETSYQPTPGRHCHSCDYPSICPAKASERVEDQIEDPFDVWREALGNNDVR